MIIIVKRPPGDKQGPDIVDELLTSEPAGIARGKREIDYHSSDRDDVSCRCTSDNILDTFKLAKVTEAEDIWAGMTRYWSLTLTIEPKGQFFTTDTRISLEKVA